MNFPPLSPLQHHFLWLRATGHGTIESQQILGTSATFSISARIKVKLQANDLLHAVFIASQNDLIGPLKDCGTMRGVRHHRWAHEDLCRACLRANGEEIELGKVRSEHPPELSVNEREYLDLLAEGYTFPQIIVKTGRKGVALKETRASLYRKLRVSGVPKQQRRWRALEEARYMRMIGRRKPLKVNQPRRPHWGTTKLTDLELKTLAALTGGTSISEAGVKLGVAAGSVSSRIAIIYRKLGVNDLPRGEKRAEAIRRAEARGHDMRPEAHGL